MLYRIQITAYPRVARPAEDDHSLEALLKYFDALKDKYLGELKASEVQVTVDQAHRAKVDFINFPGGSFSTVVDINKVLAIETPDGHSIKAFLGGRDDAFFNNRAKSPLRFRHGEEWRVPSLGYGSGGSFTRFHV